MKDQKRKVVTSKTGVKNIPAGELLPLMDFLNRFNISFEDFSKTGIEWSTLEVIFYDYILYRNKLNHPANAIVSLFLSQEAKDQGVHSVRFRIKDPHSLVEKIIRKKFQDPDSENITVNNYKNEITDLIGVRILHTFKNDWLGIHTFIGEMFNLKPEAVPIVYHREGDEPEFLLLCEDCGCKKMNHAKGYRSVHYILVTQLTKEPCFAEVQVRTIFEEGWSEIDHKIRYSYKGHKSSPFDSELSSLNRIAGSADEIGSNIKRLEQKEQERVMGEISKSRRKH